MGLRHLGWALGFLGGGRERILFNVNRVLKLQARSRERNISCGGGKASVRCARGWGEDDSWRHLDSSSLKGCDSTGGTVDTAFDERHSAKKRKLQGGGATTQPGCKRRSTVLDWSSWAFRGEQIKIVLTLNSRVR